MARYIDADALLENLKKQYGEELGWQCTVNMSDVGMMIEDAPTADVVPKSEVEEAVKKVVGATDKVICEAKAEVARDILEMVEGFMCLYEREHRPFNSSEYVTYYDIKLRDAVIGWIEEKYNVSPRFRDKEDEE